MAADAPRELPEDLPVLYSFRRCPYAMRARMSLVLAEKPVRLRELVLRDKPAPMLEASPKGTVPVLVLNNGQVIDESLDVMAWAKEPAWIKGAHHELVARNDGPFKRDLDRYKYPNRYQDVDPLLHRESGASFLRELNAVLEQPPHLSGEQPGFADYAIFPFVRQFRIPDVDWFEAQPWPALLAWLAGHLASDVFVRSMKKYPLWNDTQEEFVFGVEDGAGA